jgi:hypothetical protein
LILTVNNNSHAAKVIFFQRRLFYRVFPSRSKEKATPPQIFSRPFWHGKIDEKWPDETPSTARAAEQKL